MADIIFEQVNAGVTPEDLKIDLSLGALRAMVPGMLTEAHGLLVKNVDFDKHLRKLGYLEAWDPVVQARALAEAPRLFKTEITPVVGTEEKINKAAARAAAVEALEASALQDDEGVDPDDVLASALEGGPPVVDGDPDFVPLDAQLDAIVEDAKSRGTLSAAMEAAKKPRRSVRAGRGFNAALHRGYNVSSDSDHDGSGSGSDGSGSKGYGEESVRVRGACYGTGWVPNNVGVP